MLEREAGIKSLALLFAANPKSEVCAERRESPFYLQVRATFLAP